jgi:phage tail sheath protein FI
MPVTPTYPGIYIEEVPSGVRTITGVSTSDTAFVDYFPRGPVDTAVRITSFADFQRVFGGLDQNSQASYAIQQFYRNGGQIAWVVRVVTQGDGGAPTATAASLTLTGGSPAQDTLTVEAANPGEWGESVQVAVTQPPGTAADRFNLIVREVVTANGVPVTMANGRAQVIASETHLNLSMNTKDASYAIAAVNAGSALVRLTDAGLGDIPTPAGLDTRGNVPDAAFTLLANGNNGQTPDSAALIGDADAKTGMYALDRIEPFVFNLLCLPAAASLDVAADPPTTPNLNAVLTAAQAYCEEKLAFLIADIPDWVDSLTEVQAWLQGAGVRHRNSAVYFPRLEIPDALNQNRARNVAASGTLAGVYARTDATRGVWKAPAGIEATLRGVRGVAQKMTDPENGAINPLGINALRNFPIFGTVSWGGRTLDGADQQASEWKYIPVRRTALFIEQSLFQGLKWVVFEPNDEPLWAQIRLNAGAFMQNLFRQGAFQGTTPRDAYFVKCDRETNPQFDIDRGIVNIVVGFAPLKPAEFVILRIQQIAPSTEA